MISSERKRKRIAMSCTICRRRKIRCNRETPCSNCLRSRNVVCVYEAEPSGKLGDNIAPQLQSPRRESAVATSLIADASPTSNHFSTSSASSISHGSTVFELETMKVRIAELEEKLSQANSTAPSVYSIATSSPAPTHPVHVITSFAGAFDVLQDSRAFGHTHAISRGIAHKNRVFGQSHWMNGFVIFRDIIELIEPCLRDGSSPLLIHIKKAKVLARAVKSQRSPTWPTLPTRDLPPKPICDRLLEGYLRTTEMLYRVLHIPSFKKEYEQLWQTNAEPNMGFIVILKLVLAIGACFYDERFSMRTQAVRWVYEAQTWLSSPTIKSRLGLQYMQTSILLLLARDIVDVGSELVWISAGSVLRAAIYIGLHKDPTRLPRMTLFQSEMRRRIWNTLLEVLLQSSLESGGPCSISFEEFNTEPPGNFDDEDLMAVDPAAKPSKTYTQSSVAVALRKTFAARVAVVKFLNDISSAGIYKETLRHDTLLRATYKTLRTTLQGYALDATRAPSKFVLQAVDFTMQRYISALHVPFLGPSLHDPVYAYSRKVVVDASTKIWTLACPPLSSPIIQTPDSEPTIDYGFSTEADLIRLCRCGAGFFRTSAFHATTFIGIDLRAQVQEDEDISSVIISTGRSVLIDNAANWYLQCMQSGETGIKGYLLLRFLAVQIDATKCRTNPDEMASLLVRAAEEAAQKATLLLESIAGNDQSEAAVAAAAAAMSTEEEFDFQISADFMEDWDLVMSDAFNFRDEGSFEAFFS